jgi:protein-disulfide isomerase
LPQIHQNAFAAARAAEAAGLQNKYWQMHDTLYDQANWQQWTTSSNPPQFFNGYAQQIGLNVEQFKKDYASDKVNSAINADLAAFGKTKQQQATPAFFLDGVFIDNSKLADSSGPSASKFTDLIKAEIAKKNP